MRQRRRLWVLQRLPVPDLLLSRQGGANRAAAAGRRTPAARAAACADPQQVRGAALIATATGDGLSQLPFGRIGDARLRVFHLVTARSASSPPPAPGSPAPSISSRTPSGLVGSSSSVITLPSERTSARCSRFSISRTFPLSTGAPATRLPRLVPALVARRSFHREPGAPAARAPAAGSPRGARAAVARCSVIPFRRKSRSWRNPLRCHLRAPDLRWWRHEAHVDSWLRAHAVREPLASSSTRSSLAWIASGSSPISSRNSVPPCAVRTCRCVAVGAGERAALVAEQLALDQGSRGCGAVHAPRNRPLAFRPCANR